MYQRPGGEAASIGPARRLVNQRAFHPRGIPADDPLTEPWKQRSQRQVLLDASRRLRERVEETERFVDNAHNGQVRSAVRRCICDAENLIGLAERLLRHDWIER